MATFSLLPTSSLHRNYFFAPQMNLNSTLFQAPVFAQTSVPTFVPSSDKSEVENQTSENTEQDQEVDFVASLLMDFSKGVYNTSLALDTFSKRKSDELDSSTLTAKKNKRMPRSPSINTLVAEQTIACEEHSSKHLRCPMNCPNRRPGSKRMRSVPSDESRSSSLEVESEEAENTTPVQKKESIQLAYPTSTKFFELPKPVEVEDYVQILKWAFLQLPSLQGTFEEIFTLIRKNGWKELRNGTPREILLCKKNFLKNLENTFQLKGVDANGEHIYFSKELSPELSESETKGKKVQKRRGRPANVELPLSPTSSDFVQSPSNSAPGSPIGSLNNSEAPAFPVVGDELQMNQDDDFAEPGSPNSEKLRKKGRRWLRFACEKHRKEHTKCGENCPSRRITYTVRGTAIVPVESQ